MLDGCWMPFASSTPFKTPCAILSMHLRFSYLPPFLLLLSESPKGMAARSLRSGFFLRNNVLFQIACCFFSISFVLQTSRDS